MDETKQRSVTFWEQCGDSMHKVGDVPAVYKDYLRSMILEAGQPVHGNAEPVRVVAVDIVELGKWLPPRGRAQPVEEEHSFPSAFAASMHLGFKSNEVGRELGRRRRRLELEAVHKFGKSHTTRIRPSVTLRGVTLQYEKDVPG